MEPRMNHPVAVLPDALKALVALSNSTRGALPDRTVNLILLRASQINGCGICVELHSSDMKKSGDTDERLFAVAAWHDSPYFTDAERAALALTEAATRMSDRADPVPDAIWDEAARHYDERALAALVVTIAAINAWNRLNVTTRQLTGSFRG
jgi:AhpD family alkylhydroperoxidase